jgi:hypothetical protein
MRCPRLSSLSDLSCVHIRKSDDLRYAYANSRVLQVLLAQAVAVQIVSMLALSRRRKLQRTGGWRQAAPGPGEVTVARSLPLAGLGSNMPTGRDDADPMVTTDRR